MVERSKDWFEQAKRDLENARWELKGRFYEWSCFSAQQSAEKALKAVFQKMGGTAWGHSVRDLLLGLARAFGIDVGENLLNEGSYLDRFYIPARYPNGWPDKAPKDFITSEEAETAISYSRDILKFCEDILAGQEGGPPSPEGDS